jgi:flagellar basal-body rod modification protein FlgD
MSIGIASSTTQADAALSQANANALTNAVSSDEELGKDAFLRLLTLQLQNQDPLDPVKNEDFVAQLAQFSSLEQLTSINETLGADQGVAATDSVRIAIDSNTAVGLMGREVQVSSNSIDYSGDGSKRIGYNLEGPADNVTIRISDSAGNVIRTLVNGNPEQGNASIVWDGKDAEGDEVSSGTYQLVPSANYQGAPVEVASGAAGTVTGVRYQDGLPILITDEGETPLYAVTRVTEGS